jgi:hypothetical protein
MALYGSAKAPAVPAYVDGSTVAALTDNSGGTASETIAVIGATYDQAEVRNAVASLAAKIAALIAHMNDGRA